MRTAKSPEARSEAAKELASTPKTRRRKAGTPEPTTTNTSDSIN